VLERGLHRLRYRVEAPGPVLLVLSEVWYPAGWRAEVEGEEVAIHRTDHVLRGIRLDPAASGGTAEVVLTFDPASVAWGRRLSLATLLVLVLMIGSGLVTGTGWLRSGGGERAGTDPEASPLAGADGPHPEADDVESAAADASAERAGAPDDDEGSDPAGRESDA
jgi:hypothetical protein